MKKTFLILITLVMISCNCNKKTENMVEENEINLEKTDENEEILLGKISCKNLEQGIYNDWFIESFNAHKLDTTALNKVKPLLKNTHIKIFMGTWCEDSQREVPAFHKIMETIDIPENQYEIIAVSRDKNTPEGLEKGMDIQYVPTIIFYNNEIELIARSQSHANLLEKLFKKPKYIMEDWDWTILKRIDEDE